MWGRKGRQGCCVTPTQPASSERDGGGAEDGLKTAIARSQPAGLIFHHRNKMLVYLRSWAQFRYCLAACTPHKIGPLPAHLPANAQL